MVLPRFAHQALMGETMTVYGDGSQSRSFTHVKDTVSALSQMAQHPGAIGQIFNVGSDEEITIERLARIVKETAQSASKIRYIPYDEAYEEGFEDIRRRVPDLAKIRGLLGISPASGIEQIVRDMIGYLSETRSLDSCRKDS
jgi:UDP-glucose 4-epimerase